MEKGKTKIHISWSGGKDAAFALQLLLANNEFEVVGLHTVIDADTKRVGIHNIHESLIQAQANSIQLPLEKLYLSKKPMAYQHLMVNYYKNLKTQGITHIMFGDIFLEDLRDFRQMLLQQVGLKGVYPLWGKKSADILQQVLSNDIKTIICAADSKFFNEEVVGQFLTSDIIRASSTSDPCGENGEYHSFVVESPIFQFPVHVHALAHYSQEHIFKIKDEAGKIEEQKECFYYADLALSANN